MTSPSTRRWGRGGVAAVCCALVATPLTITPAAQADRAGTGLVISEVYLGGGNAGATYKNEFIELYNPTGAAVDVAGDVAAVPLGDRHGEHLHDRAAQRQRPGQWVLPHRGRSNGGTTPAGADLPTPDKPATGFNPVRHRRHHRAGEPDGPAHDRRLPTGNNASNAKVVDLVGYGTTQHLRGHRRRRRRQGNTKSQARAADGTDTEQQQAATSPPATSHPKAPGRSPSTPGRPAGHQDHRGDPGQRLLQPARGHQRHHARRRHGGVPHRRLARPLHPDPRHRRRRRPRLAHAPPTPCSWTWARTPPRPPTPRSATTST